MCWEDNSKGSRANDILIQHSISTDNNIQVHCDELNSKFAHVKFLNSA